MVRQHIPRRELSDIVVLSDIDRRLLNRCVEGAPGAWEDFVDRFIALITHVVSTTAELRLGHVPDQTRDDVVAEVFLKLVDKDFAILRRFRGQSSLEPESDQRRGEKCDEQRFSNFSAVAIGRD